MDFGILVVDMQPQETYFAETTHRAQYPLNQEYSLNDRGPNIMI